MTTDIDKIKEIIAKSGNSFHFKVLKHLEDLGWKTIISPYYNDNLTNKPREIDLIAEKSFEARNSYNDFLGTVNVQLFIECKFISQKTVFWFHDKNMNQAEELITHNSPFRKDNTYTKKHHYLDGKDRAAKLFADERTKQPPAKAGGLELRAESPDTGRIDPLSFSLKTIIFFRFKMMFEVCFDHLICHIPR